MLTLGPPGIPTLMSSPFTAKFMDILDEAGVGYCPTRASNQAPSSNFLCALLDPGLIPNFFQIPVIFPPKKNSFLERISNSREGIAPRGHPFWRDISALQAGVATRIRELNITTPLELRQRSVELDQKLNPLYEDPEESLICDRNLAIELIALASLLLNIGGKKNERTATLRIFDVFFFEVLGKDHFLKAVMSQLYGDILSHLCLLDPDENDKITSNITVARDKTIESLEALLEEVRDQDKIWMVKVMLFMNYFETNNKLRRLDIFDDLAKQERTKVPDKEKPWFDAKLKAVKAYFVISEMGLGGLAMRKCDYLLVLGALTSLAKNLPMEGPWGNNLQKREQVISTAQKMAGAIRTLFI